jgi:tetratricopeptide (TPR) repeat protein
MLRRYAIVLVVLMVLAPALLGAQEDPAEELERIDQLDKEDRSEEAISRSRALLDRLGTAQGQTRPQLRAGALWRLSRAIMKDTNLDQFEGLGDDEAIRRYEEGAGYAREAIEIDPSIAEAYFWEAANRGSVGKTRGVLNSLFMASDLDELLHQALRRDADYPEPYFMLGTLYRELPGRPISFGDDDSAVSFGRRAVDLHEEEFRRGEDIVPFYDYYLELAMSLWDRNWRQNKRDREQSSKRQAAGSADGPVEVAALYEGQVTIPGQSDREEALYLVREMERRLSAIADPTVRNRRDLSKARELLSDWE